jgi:hypothetical protein
MFTMVILILLGLMGVSLMVNTRAELSVSHSTYLGRDAFAKADSTAHLALFLGRALLSAQAAGDSPCDILNTNAQPGGRPKFEIKIGSDGLCGDFTLEKVTQAGEMTTQRDIIDRYLQATGSANAPGSSFTALPHVQVLYDGQVVGTAALAVYYSGPGGGGPSGGSSGGTVGDDPYGSLGGSSLKVYLVVSADGRRPQAPGEDAANYYSGRDGAPHSIVTAVYREIIVQ